MPTGTCKIGYTSHFEFLENYENWREKEKYRKLTSSLRNVAHVLSKNSMIDNV
jgi:hypothetical protein